MPSNKSHRSTARSTSPRPHSMHGLRPSELLGKTRNQQCRYSTDYLRLPGPTLRRNRIKRVMDSLVTRKLVDQTCAEAYAALMPQLLMIDHNERWSAEQESLNSRMVAHSEVIVGPDLPAVTKMLRWPSGNWTVATRSYWRPRMNTTSPGGRTTPQSGAR
jgi:hypothetical protein